MDRPSTALVLPALTSWQALLKDDVRTICGVAESMPHPHPAHLYVRIVEGGGVHVVASLR